MLGRDLLMKYVSDIPCFKSAILDSFTKKTHSPIKDSIEGCFFYVNHYVLFSLLICCPEFILVLFLSHLKTFKFN